MRLIVRNCLPFGNFSTTAVELDPQTHSVQHLRRLIFKKFRIPFQRQIIKFTKDNVTIRLTDTFPLSFYELSENTILIVEQIESH